VSASKQRKSWLRLCLLCGNVLLITYLIVVREIPGFNPIADSFWVCHKKHCIIRHWTPSAHSVTVVAVWRSGNTLVWINQVNLRRVRLVLGWVTVSGLIFRCTGSISVCNQRSRSTQPGHPFLGRRNEYQPKDDDVLLLGSKCMFGSCVGGR